MILAVAGNIQVMTSKSAIIDRSRITMFDRIWGKAVMRVFAFLVLAVGISSLGFAQEAQISSTRSAQEAMQEAMKLMMPGEGHKIFAKMAGKWSSKMKIWNSMTPGQPPMESDGESETKLIFGGRYVIEEARGTVMRMPMQRISILGYDNFKKVYTLVFFSNLETSTNTATGTLDAEGKVLT